MTTTECDQFNQGSRKWQICTGQADLPERTINAYREHWGLPPLETMPDIERKPVIRTATAISVKPVDPTKSGGDCKCGRRVEEQGVGTELQKILKSKGVPECQACSQLAKKMNQWGPAECEKRLSEIVEDIFPRAQRWVAKERPWVTALLPGAVTDFAIRTSIENLVVESIHAVCRADRVAGGTDR